MVVVGLLSLFGVLVFESMVVNNEEEHNSANTLEKERVSANTLMIEEEISPLLSLEVIHEGEIAEDSSQLNNASSQWK